MSAIVAPIARNANGWARTERSRPVSGSRSCIGRRPLRSSKRLNVEPSSPIRGESANGRGPSAGRGHRPFGRACAALSEPIAGVPWLTRGSQLSFFGRYQLCSPRSFIVAGRSTPRTSVASSRIAVARPTPSCFMSRPERVAKIANTATITTAALVTTPAVSVMPCSTACSVGTPLLPQLAHPAQDEHVVVHREAEEHDEEEDRQPRLDRAVALEPEQALRPAVLEDRDEDAVGGADAEQVEQDRLDRDDQRAEGDQQEQEAQQEHEADHERSAIAHHLVEVLRAGRLAGDLGGDARGGVERAAARRA